MTGWNADAQAVEGGRQDDLAREARMARRVRSHVEQRLLVVAGRGQPREVGAIDVNMAGGAGHLSPARAFERLAVRLRDVEEPGARRGACLRDRAIRSDESDGDHAANLSWRSAAAAMSASARANSAASVPRPKPRRTVERA